MDRAQSEYRRKSLPMPMQLQKTREYMDRVVGKRKESDVDVDDLSQIFLHMVGFDR